MLVDGHCHINSLGTQAKSNVINRGNTGYIFIDISIDLNTAEQSLSLSKANNFIYSSLGLHPFAKEKFSKALILEYQKLIKSSSKVIALGEVGIDSYSDKPLVLQKDILKSFIELSKDFDLPLILHNRWPDNIIFEILDESLTNYEKVIFHCFSQDLNFFNQAVTKGGFISFALNILRKKKNLDQVLKKVPLDRILLETDSPYMKINGRSSSPLDIEKVYGYVCEIKNISRVDLENRVFSNTKKVFKL